MESLSRLFSPVDFWHFRYDGEFGKEGFQKEIVDGGNDLFDGGNKVFVATKQKVFQVLVGVSTCACTHARTSVIDNECHGPKTRQRDQYINTKGFLWR